MRGGTCFFVGHRDAPEALLPRLEGEIERHIVEEGVSEFVAGCYGRFDAMAAGAVRRAKEAHPQVRLLCLCPYYPPRPPAGKFDGLIYPPGMERVPKRLAILRANRYMVDHCDFLIAYAWHPAGNARALVEYARRREPPLPVTCLAP